MNVIHRLTFAPIATTSTRRLIKQRIITSPQQPPQPHHHHLRRFALFFSSSSSSSSSTSSSTSKNTTTTTTQNYNFAITRNVPKSFANAVVKFASINNDDDVDHNNNNNNLNWMESQRQLDNYVNILRNNVGIPTITLEPLEDHPDCTFVEDTVVVIKDTAVITNPGHITRKGEVDTIKSLLQQLGIKNIIDMRDYCYNNNNNNTTTTTICDGGDVLYTGRHLFVGISERTNMEAVNVLSTTFQDIVEGTIPVPITEEDGNHHQHALHLKSIVTALDSHTLLIPQGIYGDTIMKQMKTIELGYDCIRLPNMLCCNVISVNNYILAQDNQGCIETRQILQDICKTKGLQLEFVNFSEFAKADAALTCCSILLSI